MRYFLLEEPIPAGTEIVTSEESYPLDERPEGRYDWYTRKELHDDHAAFFPSSFGGRQEIFYLLKVVNPGNFASALPACSRCTSTVCRPQAMRCNCMSPRPHRMEASSEERLDSCF